jgi:hypothetical protein
MAVVAEVRGTAGLQRAFPVVTTATAAPCQGQCIGAAGGVSISEQDGSAPTESGTAAEGGPILGADRCAEMKLLQKTVFIYPQEAGKTIPVKTKNAVDTFDHRTSNSCLLFMDSILVLFFAAVNDIVGDE